MPPSLKLVHAGLDLRPDPFADLSASLSAASQGVGEGRGGSVLGLQQGPRRPGEVGTAGPDPGSATWAPGSRR